MDITFTLSKYADNRTYRDSWLKTTETLMKQFEIRKFRLVTTCCYEMEIKDINEIRTIVEYACNLYDQGLFLF